MSRRKTSTASTTGSSHRAASADRLLDAIYDLYADCDQVPKTLIGYTLCDLRHLCDSQSLTFAERDHAGHEHYLEELQG